MHPSKVNTLQCSQCDTTVISEKYLEKHMEFVHGISNKPNYCQKCKRGTKGAHVCSEKKEEEAQSCEYCGKVFKQKKNLKDHIDSFHLNKNPFKCDSCGKGFPTKHRLSDHVVAHHQPAVCQICHKTLCNKWEFRKHEVYVHNKIDKDTHICDLCPKGRNIFFSSDVYARHCKKKHSMDID